jgi:hypothetical protein
MGATDFATTHADSETRLLLGGTVKQAPKLDLLVRKTKELGLLGSGRQQHGGSGHRGGHRVLGDGGSETGRSAEIRTRDPLHPMQVRYQTAPRSDRGRLYGKGAGPTPIRRGYRLAFRTEPTSSQVSGSVALVKAKHRPWLAILSTASKPMFGCASAFKALTNNRAAASAALRGRNDGERARGSNHKRKIASTGHGALITSAGSAEVGTCRLQSSRIVAAGSG